MATGLRQQRQTEWERETKKGESFFTFRKLAEIPVKCCSGGNGAKSVRRRKKVFAVSYADETVMASMPEWTQSVPQEYTEQPGQRGTAHQSAYKPTLEIENTDTWIDQYNKLMRIEIETSLGQIHVNNHLNWIISGAHLFMCSQVQGMWTEVSTKHLAQNSVWY